eukprot:ctg_1726.g531
MSPVKSEGGVKGQSAEGTDASSQPPPATAVPAVHRGGPAGAAGAGGARGGAGGRGGGVTAGARGGLCGQRVGVFVSVCPAPQEPYRGGARRATVLEEAVADTGARLRGRRAAAATTGGAHTRQAPGRGAQTAERIRCEQVKWGAGATRGDRSAQRAACSFTVVAIPEHRDALACAG